MFTHGEQLSVCWDWKFTDLVADDWLVVQKGDPNRECIKEFIPED